MENKAFIFKVQSLLVSTIVALTALSVIYQGSVNLYNIERIVKHQIDGLNKFISVDHETLRGQFRLIIIQTSMQFILLGILLLMISITFYKKKKISFMLIILLMFILTVQKFLVKNDRKVNENLNRSKVTFEENYMTMEDLNILLEK